MSIKKIDFAIDKHWIDVVAPSVKDLNNLSLRYNIPKHLVEDSVEVGHLPKIEFTDNYKFVICRFVHDFKINELKTIQEFTSKISFFFNSEYVITIHRLELDFVNSLNVKELENNSIQTTEDLVEHLMFQILKTYQDPAELLSNQIDQFEEKIFLKQISNNFSKQFYIIKRESTSMKKLLTLSNDSMKLMEKNGFRSKDFFGLKDLHTKLISQVEQNIEDVSNLINLFFSISSQNTNDIVKTLTILSIFFMPLTFIAGIYGMNFEWMPELKCKYGYPLSLLSMVLVCFIIYFTFKKKNWF